MVNLQKRVFEAGLMFTAAKQNIKVARSWSRIRRVTSDGPEPRHRSTTEEALPPDMQSIPMTQLLSRTRSASDRLKTPNLSPNLSPEHKPHSDILLSPLNVAAQNRHSDVESGIVKI